MPGRDEENQIQDVPESTPLQQPEIQTSKTPWQLFKESSWRVKTCVTLSVLTMGGIGAFYAIAGIVCFAEGEEGPRATPICQSMFKAETAAGS